MKHTITTVLSVAVLAFSSPVMGAITLWEFGGTFSAATTDSLGIDGESFSYSLAIDDTASVWTDIGGELYYPTASSSASITGGHTIALKSGFPAIRIRSANNAVVPVEAVGIASFMDFIIDGTTFVNATSTVSLMIPPVVPSAGDPFTPDNLTTVYGVPTIIIGPNGENYNITTRSISVTTIPEPSSTALLGLGGLALMLRRRR